MANPEQANALVINTNLAQPILKAEAGFSREYWRDTFAPEPANPAELDQPHLLDPALQHNPLSSVMGFRVPEDIRLRVFLYDNPYILRGLSDSQRAIAWQLQKLGHGVTGIVERDAPDTRVELQVKPATRWAHDAIFWNVSGSFISALTRIEPLSFEGYDLRGHQTPTGQFAGSLALLDGRLDPVPPMPPHEQRNSFQRLRNLLGAR